ncbi:hypothetical protein ABW286_05125 [Erwinia papayae]|uniref:Uncharacterized protein n=1 Tax=Erwinia papayae TaxID=206499 RepID=A0ABV3MYE3_9GAMM
MSENGFDPKDVAEICSRKKSKFRMKKADFKELGRNALLGTLDVALGCVSAAAIISSVSTKVSVKEPESIDGVIGGQRYVDGIRIDD